MPVCVAGGVAAVEGGKGDDDKEELKAAIVQSLIKRTARLSASLAHAVAVGDVEEVIMLCALRSRCWSLCTCNLSSCMYA
jgi:hypothetical protein